jgi:GT2 family glycosyltransferase
MPEEYEPPVVAVVVTDDAGAWLEECLASLGQQDYPSLDVLVVDTGAAGGVTNRVAAVIPGAYVRRRPEVVGFAAAANDVLVGIEGATFFLFCHDDVALAPDTVRLLVEEAFRSNAAIVGPKLVDWEVPDRLLQIGLGVNRFGAPVPRIEEGELDQSQHDEVREVFAVPSACLLARVDLFAAVGGFDPEMGAYGEDVDLCWRTQLAGARVVAAPRATVRHRQATSAGERPISDELGIRRRNQLRAVLKNYRVVRRWAIVLQLVLLTLVDSVTAPLTDRRQRARAARAAFRWNATTAHRRSLKAARSTLRDARQEGDQPVVLRMARRVRILRTLPSAMHATATPVGRRAGSDHSDRIGRGSRRVEVDKLTEWLARVQHGEASVTQLVVCVLIGLVMLFGTRDLLFGSLPVFGDLVPGPPALHLVGQWLGGRSDPGWRPIQVGPPAYGLIGLLGTVLGNSSALALRIVSLSGLVVGTIGTSRLVRAFGSPRAPVVVAVVFAGSPLVWNGIARGDVQVAVALAGLPFVFGRLARASGLRPFVPAHGAGRRGWDMRGLVAEIAPLGLLLAVMGALAPAVVLDVVVIVVALVAASTVVGGARAMLRSAAVGAGGLLVAWLCCLPWSATWLLSGARWSLFAGPVPPAGQGLGPADLLRGHVGPVGGWWGAAGLVAAAGFAFVWARGPRLAWAARWWVCALASITIAWLGNEGWLGAGGADVGVLVAPATVAFAACCGIGLAAFELDVRRHSFGWRQPLGGLAVACVVAGLGPALGATLGGRVGVPATGFDATSTEFTTASAAGARVLWIGDPSALPGSSFQVDPGLAAFVTTSGLPSVATVWPEASPGPAGRVIADVAAAEAGTTLRLGGLLAPAGIRYVVVPTADAPVLIGEQTPPGLAPPAGLLRALLNQTDLRLLPEEDGVLVWANTDWLPADGDGLIVSPRASSDPGLRGVGVAGGLVTVGACITEGAIRRRRAPKRRVRKGSPSPGDGGGERSGAAHEHGPESSAGFAAAPAAVVNAESLGHDAEPAAELPADEVMFDSAAVERAAEGPFDQAAAEAAEAAQAAEASVVAAAERVDP